MNERELMMLLTAKVNGRVPTTTDAEDQAICNLEAGGYLTWHYPSGDELAECTITVKGGLAVQRALKGANDA